MRWRRGASGGSPSHDRRPFTSTRDVRHAQAVSRRRGGEHLAGAAEPPVRRGGARRAVERARADPLPAGPGRADAGLRAAAQPRPGPSYDGAHGGGDLRMGRDEGADVMNGNGRGATNGNGHGANGRPRRKRGLMEAVRPPFLRHRVGPVLVVGGAGYIGTHVVEQLLAQGRRVRVLDPLMFGWEPVQDFLANPRFELVEGDATDVLKLIEAMHGASAVAHFAGLVGDPACAVDESVTRHANVFATRLVKKAALLLGVQRLVFASSCSVYGINSAEVNETSEVNPVSLYARTKVEGERELLLGPEGDCCVTVLRFATVFGHSRRPRFDLVANLFTAQAVNDGKITLMGPSQWRPFVHLREPARALVAVLDADPERVRG